MSESHMLQAVTVNRQLRSLSTAAPPRTRCLWNYCSCCHVHPPGGLRKFLSQSIARNAPRIKSHSTHLRRSRCHT